MKELSSVATVDKSYGDKSSNLLKIVAKLLSSTN